MIFLRNRVEHFFEMRQENEQESDSMLKELSTSNLPRFMEKRERVGLHEVSALRIENNGGISVDIIEDVWKAVLAVGFLLQGPILFTLGANLSRETLETRHSVSFFTEFFNKILFFKEGNLYKMQLERIKSEKRAEIEKFLNPNIMNLFGLRPGALEPIEVKAYSVQKQDSALSSKTADIQNMAFLTEYFLREARMNNGKFCIPFGNLSKEQIETDSYIDFLQNHFREIYVVGAGAEWFSTHLFLVDPLEK